MRWRIHVAQKPFKYNGYGNCRNQGFQDQVPTLGHNKVKMKSAGEYLNLIPWPFHNPQEHGLRDKKPD